MPTSKRLYYLDNLRVGLTVLVIAHHVGQAYGPTGGYWPIQEAQRAAILGPFFTVNRSFFMSLFFMISGYLTVPAFERHGLRGFARGRLLRLGIPVLVWAAIMVPMRLFVFGERITSWTGIIDVGHLWFLEHLLLFSLAYALWRHLRHDTSQGQREAPIPGYLTILAFGLGVAVVTGIVRIWYPIDRWVNVLGFLRAAFADVPRDLSFFVVGLLAYRRGWFERFPSYAGRVWLGIGVAASVAWSIWALALYDTLPLRGLAFDVTYLLWEELLCFGLCIGLLVLFRDAFDRQGALGRALAEAQYGAYILHPAIVTGLQAALLAVALGPFAKFALVALAGVPLTFLASYWMRQPRAMRAVL